MAKLNLLIPLPPPLTDLPPDPTALIDPEDIAKLKTDVVNVYEGRVLLTSFDAEYQQRILNFYRFCATAYTTKNQLCAKRTTNTLDII